MHKHSKVFYNKKWDGDVPKKEQNILYFTCKSCQKNHEIHNFENPLTCECGKKLIEITHKGMKIRDCDIKGKDVEIKA